MANLTEIQQRGRAKNAISTYFDKRLTVPKIFMDAEWDGANVDVLAIDRAGVGDVYIISILPQIIKFGLDHTANPMNVLLDSSLQVQMKRMLTSRSQIRYVTCLGNTLAQKSLFTLTKVFGGFTDGFAEDGIGRVGVLFVDITAGDFEVHEIVKAERFRSTKQILELTDKFVVTHTADMEYRDPIYEQEAIV